MTTIIFPPVLSQNIVAELRELERRWRNTYNTHILANLTTSEMWLNFQQVINVSSAPQGNHYIS